MSVETAALAVSAASRANANRAMADLAARSLFIILKTDVVERVLMSRSTTRTARLERPEKQAFNRLRAELVHAFAAPESSYKSLTAAQVIARNRAKARGDR